MKPFSLRQTARYISRGDEYTWEYGLGRERENMMGEIEIWMMWGERREGGEENNKDDYYRKQERQGGFGGKAMIVSA